MRDMRIIAYFRQCFKGKEVNTIKELTHELASHIPYEVPISSLTINHLHCQVKRKQYKGHIFLIHMIDDANNGVLFFLDPKF